MNKIYSNYYLRIVIFAAFAYKRYFDKEIEYQQMVTDFITKRLVNHGPQIDLLIKRRPELTDGESRDLILDNILFDTESEKLIEIQFSLNRIEKKIIIIDLNNEEKYELFLYG